ncbi:NAD(P)H-dependent oxidoreductase [Frankia sp. CNm7]|uniref:NAD(P)H-dependent oxidoreductase n=1 Tax=Frankia nepalensis TaxID=1836974 RepID=A0A937REW4_9ACTN|nr:NAD(P)H-dependent oxidoreductase [Frankia nepalensis]MBL7508311.1 NAD(P)H-dependent oxidoreductase [Frankia nepalensis]MBL7520997.1 NAD(P)H-dependent oxidoreductase [Frankia nepalensis]MBL7626139.1 NAD(P)H-dependent oxidoreductase [Frankia nepalensis]
MWDDQLRLALIVASVREGRFATTVADWFAGEATTHPDFDVDVIDVREAMRTMVKDDPAVHSGAVELSPRLGVASRLDTADAFVVITPEYNHSYPAALKILIDAHHVEWAAKPVAFVAYGGLSGGLRAVEHLRAVFAELHATTLRDTVSFHGARARFGPDGQPHDPTGPTEAAKLLLDRLAWWAHALRAARATHPYAA